MKTVAISLWIIKVFCLLIADIVVTIFAPFICLFVRMEEESKITNFPSQFPGNPREFLIKQLMWCQTTDAPLDEMWYGDYPSKFKQRYDQAYYDTHWWLRYVMRVMWIWRNPAYGFGTALGYDATGLQVINGVDVNLEPLWKTGVNCRYNYTYTNTKGQWGWTHRSQWYYYKQHCLELYLGYKIAGDTIKGKKLVAMQCTPFRQYEKDKQ